MSASWPQVSLGTLLNLERRPVEVLADNQYAEIGIYCFGRGIFHKTARSGLEVGNKDLYLIKENDFILQVTFAWEGAVALASAADDGMFGSSRFPTFRVDESRCYAPYLLNYFKTPAGREQIVKISPGSAGRNRVLSLKRIHEVVVPLPTLAEQQRIVARIEELAINIEEACELRCQAFAETEALLSSVKDDFLNCSAGSKVVRDFATIQSGYAFKSEWFSDEGIKLVRNINIGHGSIDWGQVVKIPAIRRSEFYRFELFEGDLLISLDRPIISSGIKVAKVSNTDIPSLLLQRVGRVVFSNKLIIPCFFFAWLRSPYFAAAIDPGRSNGVPHISQKDIERIPFNPPSLSEQRRIIDFLGTLQAKADELKQLQAGTAAELDAMLPSILDKAFQGELI